MPNLRQLVLLGWLVPGLRVVSPPAPPADPSDERAPRHPRALGVTTRAR